MNRSLPLSALTRQLAHGLAGTLRWPRWAVYVLATVLPLAALFFRLQWLETPGAPPLFILLFLPVIVSAYLGGLGPGLWTTVLTAGGTAYFLVWGTAVTAGSRNIRGLQWLSMVLAACLVSGLTEALHRARRRAEASEQFQLLTLASMGDAVIVTDVQGQVTFLNAEAERLTGWSYAEALAQPLAQVWCVTHATVAQPLNAVLERVLQDCVPASLPAEAELIARSGRRWPIEDTVAPLKDETGTVRGLVLTFRDATKKREAANVFRERLALQEQLASIVATAPGVIYSFRRKTDGTYSFPFASDKLEDLCGLRVADLAADGALMFTCIHLDDAARVRASIEESGRNLAPWHCEFRILKNVTVETWVQGAAVPSREADGSILWHGVLLDVTSRKEQEAALQEARQLGEAVLNSLSTSLAVVDFAGTILDVNAGWQQHRSSLTAAPAHWACLAKGENCLTPGAFAALNETAALHSANIAAGVQSVLTGEQEKFVYEYVCPAATGQRWYWLSVTPLRHCAGGAVLAHLEITEHKLAEDALRRSEAQLQLGVNVAGLALAQIDYATGQIHLRAQMAMLLGLSSAHLTLPLEAFYALIHLDDRAKVLQATERSLDPLGDGRAALEYRIVRSDGQMRWVTVHQQTVFAIDDQGQRQATHAHLAAQDVTERKLAEVALQLSEERLRAFHRIIANPYQNSGERIQQLLALGTQQFGLVNGVLAQVMQRQYRVRQVYSLDSSITRDFACDLGQTLCQETLSRNELLVIENVGDSSWCVHPACQTFGTEVYFGVPVRVDNHPYGTLCFTSRTPRLQPFSNGDQEFLRLMAQWIGAELTRQHSEDELRRSEEQQRLALEAGNMGTWCWYPETSEMEVDENCRQLMRVEHLPLIDSPTQIRQFVHPDDLSQISEEMVAAWHNRTTYASEFRWLQPEQPVRWLRAIGRGFYQSNGKFSGFNGVIFDVTERKRAEAALRESEERFRTLFEQAAVGNVVVNLTTRRVVDCNSTAAELLGYTRAELLASSFEETSAQASLLDLLRQAATPTAEQTVQLESTCLTRSGARKNVIAVISQLRLQGEDLSCIALLDITEKKQAEAALQKERERLANIATSSPSALYSFRLTAAGHYSYPYVSQAFSALYGLSLEAVMQDASLTTTLVHPADLSGLTRSILASARTLTNWHYVWRINHPQKGEVWIEGYSAPVREADGSTIWHGILNDVTERQRAEQDLRESEARFRQLADSAPVLIWMAGTDSACNYFNRGWLEFTGHTFEEEIGYGWAHGIHPEDVEACVTNYEAAFAARQLFEMEYRLRRADGEYRWLFDKGVPRWTPNGEFSGYIGSCVDITERKQAADAVNHSRAQLEAVFQAIQDGIVVSDMAGNFLLVNDAEARICGYASAEEMKANLDYFAKVFVLTYPDGQLLPVEEWPINKILHGQSIQDWELRGRRLDTGQEWFFSYSGEPVWNEQGEQILAVISTRDITARKQAEEKIQKQERWYRALIEHSSDSIAVINETGHIIYVSPAVQSIEGYAPEELIGMGMALNTNPEDLPYVQEVVRELCAAPGKTLPVLWRRRHKDGHWLWLEGVSTNLLDDPAVRGIVTNYRDVTSRKATEDQLLVSEEQLRQLATHLQTVREEERTNIAREIHDELGQMLTAVRMNLKWIEKEVPPTALTVKRRLGDTLDLVGQTIQTVRRISTSLHPTILDDFGLLAALEWQIKEFQKHSGIVCEFECAPLAIELDRNCALAVFRICQETLTNVARHAQASKVTISLTIEANYLSLCVRDNGRGISTEALTQTRSLGLVSMRERAQSFGGEFEFAGQPGRGTTVRVRIPLFGRPVGLRR